MIAAEAFERTDGVRESRIYAEELREDPGRFVMLFRQSMISDLERARCLEGAQVVWSMWRGYLDGNSALEGFVKRLDRPLAFAHASGHADASGLRQLIADLDPARVVPMHTPDPQACLSLSDRVELHADGEWWPV